MGAQTFTKEEPQEVSQLENLIVELLTWGYRFYRMTGHDILQYPEKQALLLQTDREASLIQEGKQELGDTEQNLKRLLKAVEVQVNVTLPRYYLEALTQARLRCAALLQEGKYSVNFKHLDIVELCRLGLYFDL